MAKHKKFLVGKTPVDLDKMSTPQPNVSRRVRCPECGYRSRFFGKVGAVIPAAACPNCNRTFSVTIPEIDV